MNKFIQLMFSNQLTSRKVFLPNNINPNNKAHYEKIIDVATRYLYNNYKGYVRKGYSSDDWDFILENIGESIQINQYF